MSKCLDCGANMPQSELIETRVQNKRVFYCIDRIACLARQREKTEPAKEEPKPQDNES